MLARSLATLNLMWVVLLELARRPGVVYTYDRTRATEIVCMLATVMRTTLVVHLNQWHNLQHQRVRYRYFVPRAREVWCVSDFVRRAAEAAGIPRTHVLLNALRSVDTSQTVSRPDARAALDLREDVHVVSLVGRLSPFKGQDTFIRAISLVEKHSAVALLAGGDNGEGIYDQPPRPDYEGYLRSLAAELGVSESVRFLGHRSSAEVYAASDVVCNCSDGESFGLVTIEAMLQERPVVGARSGGTPEIIIDGETGLLVEPRNPEALATALMTLFDQPEEAASLGRTGRQRALSEFGPRRYAAEVGQRLSGLGLRIPQTSVRDTRGEASNSTS